MKAIAMGVHVLDVLVRPVESIPEGQGGQLVEEIRMTAAGSAGGTALVLARLGAEVRSAGAVGTDPVGDMLVRLLERDGVDTSLLVRRDAEQTSASVQDLSGSVKQNAVDARAVEQLASRVHEMAESGGSPERVAAEERCTIRIVSAIGRSAYLRLAR